MRELHVTIPEIGLIAGTRGMIGAGVGLLLADKLPGKQRRTIGWTLFLVGAASTIPIAFAVFGKQRRVSKGQRRRCATNGRAEDDCVEAGV